MSSLPWPSQVPVRQDKSCWASLMPVSIPFNFIFHLYGLVAGGSELFVQAATIPHCVPVYGFVVLFSRAQALSRSHLDASWLF